MRRLAILCALAGCATGTRPLPVTEPYVIADDGGGNLVAAMADRAMLERWGGRVEIAGTCASACTIFASLPNACLRADAVLEFHAATTPEGDIWPRANAFLAAFYRAGIAARFDRDWSRRTTLTPVPARQAVQLDPQMKICP